MHLIKNALKRAALIFSVVTVPFTYFDNRMMIVCNINGKGPFHVIVDTGDPTISITPETSRRLGLTVRNAGTVTGAGNNVAQRGSTTLARLAIGSLLFSDVAADVIDLSQIREKFHFPYLDGIVGYTVLKGYATFVHVDAGTLSFDTALPAVPSNAKMTPFTGTLPGNCRHPRRYNDDRLDRHGRSLFVDALHSFCQKISPLRPVPVATEHRYRLWARRPNLRGCV